MNRARDQLDSGYPEVITSLPKADIQFKGVRAWILQGEKTQLVFFEMQASASVPEHVHDYPQWGIVIDGEMDLIIDGKPMSCMKGTEYLVPAGAKHYARFHKKTRLVDYFSEKTRYRPKLP